MTILVVLLIFLLFTSDGTSSEVNAMEGDYQLTITDYNFTKSSCNQSDTCHGIDQARLSIHDLRTRNCMCDEQCILYEDCCKDSKFQTNSSTPQNKFACVSTASNGFVYMIASCPTFWNQSRGIQERCHNVSDPLPTLDVWILTPVTTQSGITYKNMFCAFCHGEINFNFWKIQVSCTPTGDLANSVTQNLLDPSDVLSQVGSNGTYPVIWQSPKSTTYHCSWHGKSTNNTSLRFCVPQSEIICTSSNCSNTSNLHVDNSKSANHKVNTLDRSSGCYHPGLNHIGSPFAVNILNPHIIAPLCQLIPHNTEIFKKVCKVPEPESKTEYSCFTKKKCVIEGWFVINETVTFLDNNTIFIKDLTISYPSSEWLAVNETSVYICASYTPRSTFQKIVYVLDDWISEIAIKFSIICLLLHLFIFQQLPQLRNFSAKNLAIFCATLLVAFLCWEVGPKLPRCEVVAVILHYSLVSCFTWSLLMSYDCWRTLRLATKELRQAGGKHTLRLCVYCVISWLIPGLVAGGALYFDLSSPEEIPCKKKVGFGKYQQCFIGQVYGLITFFIFPATCLFLGSICFFVLTSVMIYGEKKSSVNPHSKIDFFIYLRLALMMGLTWFTGTLFHLTNFAPLGLVFSSLNMSQGVLIFFAFTFKRKTLKLLLEKYEKNAKVVHVLQILLRDPVSEAPTQMTNVESSNCRTEPTYG